MLDKLKLLGKQTAVYGFGNVLNKLIGFILIPIYQAHIPITSFGYLVYFETIIVFLTSIINFGIIPAHPRFFYIEKENKTYGKYLFNNYFGCLVISVLFIIPFLSFSASMSNLLFGNLHQSFNLKITLWIVVVETMYTFALQVLQYEGKPVNYLFYNAMKLIITFALTIVFVVGYSTNYEGILYARLIGSVVTTMVTLVIIILPRCTFKFDFEYIKNAVRFGFPYIISTIGITLYMVSDRFMLNSLSTPEELGKYGFGMKIANFINLLFIQTIGLSYFPSAMSIESKPESYRFYRKMLTYYCFFISLMILFFLFSYKDILWIVGKNKDYWAGLKIVPLLSLSFMIIGMDYFLGLGLFITKKTKYFMLASFTALIINILINYLMIPKIAMMGAALGILAAQTVYILIVAYFSSKFMKVEFEWLKIALIFFISISIYFIGEYFNFNNLFMKYMLRVVLLTVYPIVLYKLNFFEAIEIEKIKGIFHNYYQKIKFIKN